MPNLDCTESLQLHSLKYETKLTNCELFILYRNSSMKFFFSFFTDTHCSSIDEDGRMQGRDLVGVQSFIWIGGVIGKNTNQLL